MKISYQRKVKGNEDCTAMQTDLSVPFSLFFVSYFSLPVAL